MSELSSNTCLFGDKGWDEYDEEKIWCIKNGEWCPYLIDGIEQEGCGSYKEIK